MYASDDSCKVAEGQVKTVLYNLVFENWALLGNKISLLVHICLQYDYSKSVGTLGHSASQKLQKYRARGEFEAQLVSGKKQIWSNWQTRNILLTLIFQDIFFLYISYFFQDVVHLEMGLQCPCIHSGDRLCMYLKLEIEIIGLSWAKLTGAGMAAVCKKRCWATLDCSISTWSLFLIKFYAKVSHSVFLWLATSDHFTLEPYSLPTSTLLQSTNNYQRSLWSFLISC